MIKSCAKNAVQTDLLLIGHTYYVNPHSSMEKTAPTSLHTGSQPNQPFGPTNSTAELCCYL